jgi:hypothetical protein
MGKKLHLRKNKSKIYKHHAINNTSALENSTRWYCYNTKDCATNVLLFAIKIPLHIFII